MKFKVSRFVWILPCILSGALMADHHMETPPQIGDIKFPKEYKNWRVINVSHRLDNHTLRAILGNDKAVEAARKGQTNPWPDGAVLGKVLWKEKKHEAWPDAIVGDWFVHAEFMVKDSKKYKDMGGWGYARWVGNELKPYGKDYQSAAAECHACHTPVQNNDFVFTHPAPMP